MNTEHKVKLKSAEDIFIWWAKQKVKQKPHLRLKNNRSNSRESMLVSVNKDEIKWMEEQIPKLEAELLEMEEKRKKNKRYNINSSEKRYYELRNEITAMKIKIQKMENLDPNTQNIVMRFKVFKDIISRFNLKARDRMINHGQVIGLKNKLGYLGIQKVKRNNNNRWESTKKSHMAVNWGRSRELKQELIDKGITPKSKENPDGAKWLVYFTDEYYLHYHWIKNGNICICQNKKYYKFHATYHSKRELSSTNKKNKVLHMKYMTETYNPPKRRKAAA